MVPAGDETGFAQAILELIEDEEKRNQLGRAARQFIEDEYSVEVAVRALEDTYRQVAWK
jgi:glycosyltransferase involved in cell wall biosynthesis